MNTWCKKNHCFRNRYHLAEDEDSGQDEAAGGTSYFINNEQPHPHLRRASAIDTDETLPGPRRRGLRVPPSMNVTREIDHTLAHPAATRGSNESDPNDKAMNPAAPASETMCWVTDTARMLILASVILKKFLGKIDFFNKFSRDFYDQSNYFSKGKFKVIF